MLCVQGEGLRGGGLRRGGGLLCWGAPDCSQRRPHRSTVSPSRMPLSCQEASFPLPMPYTYIDCLPFQWPCTCYLHLCKPQSEYGQACVCQSHCLKMLPGACFGENQHATTQSPSRCWQASPLCFPITEGACALSLLPGCLKKSLQAGNMCPPYICCLAKLKARTIVQLYSRNCTDLKGEDCASCRHGRADSAPAGG